MDTPHGPSCSGVERGFFDRPVTEVARSLLGTAFYVDGVGGTVVETEAYASSDPAAHSFRGETPRNRAMFGPFGHAYVYRSYGLHWCVNTVCRPGDAVLIRALEPLAGIELMRARRRVEDVRLLCSGPGRLCRALAITAAHDGAALDRPPFRIERVLEPAEVRVGRRIGITKGVEAEWRFGIAGSRFLSRPF